MWDFLRARKEGRESSGKPGAGIGLVVTRTLVQLMRGQLGVRSTPGAGCEFTVTLPVGLTRTSPAS